jgi:CRISPR-associated protein Csm5
MNYRLTVLTPLLVGDGQRLSPIDYMVWKDQINVLDQKRIFRLLARGPRLEGYLQEIKKAERLDFASWGGFAQNFAGRRIPFEHPSSSAVWERAQAENLHIPTFCAGPKGAYIPGSALKGALRTGLASARWNAPVIREIASRMEGDRPLRKPGESAELMTFGPSGNDPMKGISAADSDSVAVNSFKIYLVKVAKADARANKVEVSWKPSGSIFAEMAAPGTVFEGRAKWKDNQILNTVIRASNHHAGTLLALHRNYAEQAGLPRLAENLQSLESRLSEANGRACLLDLGWGGGFLSKVGFTDTNNEDYRKILRNLPFYSRSIRPGVLFPKTRRIVFLGNEPAAIPGWVLVEFQ